MYQLNIANNQKGFAERTKAIFDKLVTDTSHIKNDEIEIDEHVDENDETKSWLASKSISSNLSELKLDDEKIFIKPAIPDQPDYVINPHKWKKYSLEDITESQMNASANFQAAFSFLNRNEQKFDLNAEIILYNKPIGKGANTKKFLNTDLNVLDLVEEEMENDDEKMSIDSNTFSNSSSFFKKLNKNKENNKKTIRTNLKDLDEEETIEINNHHYAVNTSESNNKNNNYDITKEIKVEDDAENNVDNFDNDYDNGIDSNDYLN